MGTDEAAINGILGGRSAEQRLKISLMFKTMYGKDMTKDIKSETSGHYKQLLVALLDDRPHYDAKCLRRAMKGAGTDEQTLIETLCTRTNAGAVSPAECFRSKEAFGQHMLRKLRIDEGEGEEGGEVIQHSPLRRRTAEPKAHCKTINILQLKAKTKRRKRNERCMLHLL